MRVSDPLLLDRLRPRSPSVPFRLVDGWRSVPSAPFRLVSGSSSSVDPLPLDPLLLLLDSAERSSSPLIRPFGRLLFPSAFEAVSSFESSLSEELPELLLLEPDPVLELQLVASLLPGERPDATSDCRVAPESSSPFA